MSLLLVSLLLVSLLLEVLLLIKEAAGGAGAFLLFGLFRASSSRGRQDFSGGGQDFSGGGPVLDRARPMFSLCFKHFRALDLCFLVF